MVTFACRRAGPRHSTTTKRRRYTHLKMLNPWAEPCLYMCNYFGNAVWMRTYTWCKRISPHADNVVERWRWAIPNISQQAYHTNIHTLMQTRKTQRNHGDSRVPACRAPPHPDQDGTAHKFLCMLNPWADPCPYVGNYCATQNTCYTGHIQNNCHIVCQRHSAMRRAMLGKFGGNRFAKKLNVNASGILRLSICCGNTSCEKNENKKKIQKIFYYNVLCHVLLIIFIFFIIMKKHVSKFAKYHCDEKCCLISIAIFGVIDYCVAWREGKYKNYKKMFWNKYWWTNKLWN